MPLRARRHLRSPPSCACAAVSSRRPAAQAHLRDPFNSPATLARASCGGAARVSSLSALLAAPRGSAAAASTAGGGLRRRVAIARDGSGGGGRSGRVRGAIGTDFEDVTIAASAAAPVPGRVRPRPRRRRRRRRCARPVGRSDFACCGWFRPRRFASTTSSTAASSPAASAPPPPALAAAVGRPCARSACADNDRVGLRLAFALGAQRLVLRLFFFGDREMPIGGRDADWRAASSASSRNCRVCSAAEIFGRAPRAAFAPRLRAGRHQLGQNVILLVVDVDDANAREVSGVVRGVFDFGEAAFDDRRRRRRRSEAVRAAARLRARRRRAPTCSWCSLNAATTSMRAFSGWIIGSTRTWIGCAIDARELFALVFVPIIHLHCDRRRDVHDDVARRRLADACAANLAERFDRDRLRRHHASHAAAGRTRAAQLSAEVFADALARELEQPEIRKRLDRRARAVAAQAVFDRFDDLARATPRTPCR